MKFNCSFNTETEMGSCNIVLISFKKETEMEDDRDGPLQLISAKIIFDI